MSHKTKEEKQARRELERSYPKCACGNTLGIAAVQVGEGRCARCRDVMTLRESQLLACRECGKVGHVGSGFNAYYFGGDVDIDCTGCGSHTGPAMIASAIKDLVDEVIRLRAAVKE